MSESWLEEWVEHGEEDYRAAVALDAADVPRAVCFHCQQCVEKYLKAALIKHGMPTRKTHNLLVLTRLLQARDDRFSEFDDPARRLTPYAVEARYPRWRLTADDATEALDIMRDCRHTIRRILGLPAYPQAPGQS